MRRWVALFLMGSGLLGLTLCIGYALIGDIDNVVYRYTGNEKLFYDTVNGFEKNGDNTVWVELQNVETLHKVWYPKHMLPEEIKKGDVIEIQTKYSVSSPNGEILKIQVLNAVFES